MISSTRLVRLTSRKWDRWREWTFMSHSDSLKNGPPGIRYRPQFRLRHTNPSGMTSDSLVASICIDLAQMGKDNSYAFLDSERKVQRSFVEGILDDSEAGNKGELLDLLQALMDKGDKSGNAVEIERECIEKFQDWAGKSKLSIAYLLYTNENLTSDAFIYKLVRYLAEKLEALSREEVVAMMLMIYFRRNWEAEEMFEYLDPTLLQSKLAHWLQEGLLTYSERAAIILGLKKISGFIVNHKSFRESLYGSLCALTNRDESDLEEMGLSDMVVVNTLVMLAKHNGIFKDSIQTISKLMDSFANWSGTTTKLNTGTAVKLMSFAVRRCYHNPMLTQRTVEMLEQDSSSLALREIVGTLNFLVRINPDKVYMEGALSKLSAEISGVTDIRNVQDASDMLQCQTFLASAGKGNLEWLGRLFSKVNSQDTISGENICREMIRELYPASLGNLQEVSKAEASRFVKNLVFADACLSIQNPTFQKMSGLRSDLSCSMLEMFQERVPAEAHSPQLPLESLPFRQKILVTAKRTIDEYFCIEGFCDLLHILPQFSEPEFVFGHIAGNPVRIPPEFRDLRPGLIKKAPEMVEMVVFNIKVDSTFPDPETFVSGSGANEELKRVLLAKLGYKLVNIEARSVNAVGNKLIKTIHFILAGKSIENDAIE